MIDKYLLDEFCQRNDEKGELARWVIELGAEVDRERRKSAALEREIYRLQGIVNTPPAPEGFKLVPIEPTPEMIAAAMNCDDVLFDKHEDDVFYVQHRAIYEAMLAAAPGNPE